MKTKKISKEVRHKVVEKHRSGEGYQKISNSLIIPLSTMKSIIKKCRTYHTTQTLPRSGRPSKLNSQASKQEIGSGCHCKSNNDFERSAKLRVQDGGQCSSINNIPYPHKAGLYGQVARKKLFLKKTHLKAHGVCKKAS